MALPALFLKLRLSKCGPVLDGVSEILSDGYTIKLRAITSMVEFLGYAPSANTMPAYNSAGQE